MKHHIWLSRYGGKQYPDGSLAAMVYLRCTGDTFVFRQKDFPKRSYPVCSRSSESKPSYASKVPEFAPASIILMTRRGGETIEPVREEIRRRSRRYAQCHHPWTARHQISASVQYGQPPSCGAHCTKMTVRCKLSTPKRGSRQLARLRRRESDGKWRDERCWL